MNIIFFGSSEFCLPSLRAISESKHNLLLVVTHPDRKKGRHLLFSSSLVKTFAKEKRIEVFQPEILDEYAIKYLEEKNPELFVVSAFGKILNKRILEIPKRFCINIHPSLLPKYRGSAPINWAIINGEKKTGVTIFKMNEKMDAGDIILQEPSDIEPSDTSITLEGKLSRLAAELLVRALNLIENNNFSLTPQDENQISFAPKLRKSDGFIDWNQTAEDIHNRVRGLILWPGAFTYWREKLLKIWISCVELDELGEPGRVIKISKEKIIVSCRKGSLGIKELQLESGKRLTVEQFIAGHKMMIGEKLG